MSDVAKLAGVGTMTVSRVLNGNDRVSSENRERILQAISTLRYVPNDVARSLRTQKARQIGLIVPTIRDPFFATCSDAVQLVAKAKDYSVVLATSDESAETEFTEATRLLRHGIAGLVVIPAARGRSRLEDAAFAKVPIVAVDRPGGASGIDSVLVENERGACLGTEHLLKHGHQRITHLTLARDLYTMQRRSSGYRKAMVAAGLKPEIRVVGGLLRETLEIVRDLIASPEPPTAVFCANNVVSCNVFHALLALGVVVPKQVAVVGFDDFETADILQPAMTVVRQPFEELGARAAELLFARMEQRSPAIRGQNVILPVELIVRKSCGCP